MTRCPAVLALLCVALASCESRQAPESKPIVALPAPPLAARFIWLPGLQRMLTADGLFADPAGWQAVNDTTRQTLLADAETQWHEEALTPSERAERLQRARQGINAGLHPAPKSYGLFEPMLGKSGRIAGLRFLFPSQQVGAYADGVRSALVPASAFYAHLRPELKPLFEPGNESFSSGEQRFRGQAVINAQGLALTLCGEKEPRPAVLEAQAQAAIDQLISAPNSAKSRPFFLDAWGARRKDGGLRLGRIERAHHEGPGCAENLSEFVVKARGNEPFWALSADRHTLRFQRPEAPAYTGSYAHSLLADGSRRYEADTEGGRLTLTLARQPCRDGMADAVFGWTAEVSMGQKEWDGCGYVGADYEAK